jgi:hypothetical protein
MLLHVLISLLSEAAAAAALLALGFIAPPLTQVLLHLATSHSTLHCITLQLTLLAHTDTVVVTNAPLSTTTTATLNNSA